MSAPTIILSLPTSVGYAPEILKVGISRVYALCGMCGKEYSTKIEMWNYGRRHSLQKGLTCSISCGMKRNQKVLPQMANGRDKLPPFLKGNVPWNKGGHWSDEKRAVLSASAKARGQRPTVRGGNGQGMSPMEALLRTVLPEGFVWNYPITLVKKQEGYPTHYKLDFANPATHLGIEVQGNTHNTTLGQYRDKKKREKLAEFGWSILYITNVQVASMFSTSK